MTINEIYVAQCNSDTISKYCLSKGKQIANIICINSTKNEFLSNDKSKKNTFILHLKNDNTISETYMSLKNAIFEVVQIFGQYQGNNSEYITLIFSDTIPPKFYSYIIDIVNNEPYIATFCDTIIIAIQNYDKYKETKDYFACLCPSIIDCNDTHYVDCMRDVELVDTSLDNSNDYINDNTNEKFEFANIIYPNTSKTIFVSLFFGLAYLFNKFCFI